MPYLWGAALEAHRTGVPMLRPMLLDFPDDLSCETLDRQYMLGDSLLVAPVFSSEGEVTYYAPEGTWTSLLTGETVQGGVWRHETHDMLSLPLLVRPNTVLAIGSRTDTTDYDFTEEVTFRVYGLEDGKQATATIHSAKGEEALSAVVTRSGNEVSATVRGDGVWRVVWIGEGGRESVFALTSEGEASLAL